MNCLDCKNEMHEFSIAHHETTEEHTNRCCDCADILFGVKARKQAETSKKKRILQRDKMTAALQKAFKYGTRTADGYIKGLDSMGSKKTVGEGDEAAAKVKLKWLEVRTKLLDKLGV